MMLMEVDRVRVRDLEDQILDLERTLSELRAQQAQVQERLDAYKYPVLTLPNEIISEIFTYFIPVYPALPPLTGLRSPTTLTHICHRWREVAVATPALWRAIRLDYWSLQPVNKQLHCIADAWVERSRTCRLSIDIKVYKHDLLPVVFTEPMAAAATRWEHLSLWLDSRSHPEIGLLPLLRSLNLVFRPGDKVFTYDVPQLRTVSLLGRVVPNVALPWAQLTCLTLSQVAINRCVSVLRQTTNLVQCELHFYSLHGPFEFPGPDLALPCLKFLSLIVTSQPVDGYLSSFVVPALRRLELDEIFLGMEPVPGLEMFITKSECRLQEVHISGKNKHPNLYQQAFPSISFSYHQFPIPFQGSDEDAAD
ncbi:hypothetical protein C8R45DRAFT_578682 [Mycena sanguinolenta]|nr:hypothetical protein C8R45DRAFT_578682 [Mycena sanguinolenta]